MTAKLPKFYTLEEFSAELNLTHKWVIEPFGFLNSVIMLYGGEGLGKSRLLTQMAYSVITGEPWLGFPVHLRGPVVYLTLDMPRMEQEKLLTDLRRSGMYDEMVDDFYLYSGEFNIRERQFYDHLRGFCDEVEPAMVILDTAYQGFDAKEESNIIVRRVVKLFSGAVYPALFSFAHHKDKHDDYALGFGEWGRVVSTSLRLFEAPIKGKPLRMGIMKCRLANNILRQIELHLRFDQHGFIEKSQEDLWQMLLYYQPTGQEDSITEVFETIAGFTKKSADSVRGHYYRDIKGRGIVPEWSKHIADDK